MAFLGVASLVLFLFLSFHQGAENQINSTIKKVYGDIRVTARGDHSLWEVGQYLHDNYKQSLQKTTSQLSLNNCELTGSGNYRETSVTGVGEDYFQWLGDSIYWESGGPFGLENQRSEGLVNAVLENSYADKLNLELGDTVTVKYEPKSGKSKELKVSISGVFIGNRFQQGGKLFLPLNQVQKLAGSKHKIDLIKINLLRPSDENLHRITSGILDNYKMAASVSVRKWESSLSYSTIFSSVWGLVGLILVLTGLAIIIVLSLGVYDTFYLDLRSRTEEISSLLTYGIGHGKLYLLNFLEVSILLIVGGGVGLLLALVIVLTLGNIPLVKNFGYLFIVLGGPFLEFTLFSREIVIGFALTALAAYASSFLSLRSYLRKEVAEIVD